MRSPVGSDHRSTNPRAPSNVGFVRSAFLYQSADLYKDGPMRPVVVLASFATIVAPACQLMDEGHSEPDVIKGMTQQNAGFSNDAATKFTQIAESVFCPQHTGGAVTPPQPTTPWNPPPFLPWPPIPAAL
jgi:hypothetical protein